MGQPVVVVTGGGSGIGRAVCRRFAADGAQVVAAARSGKDLAETQSTIQQAGGKCHVLPTDVTSTEDVDALIEDATDRFGRIDVLVNNAGIAPLASLEETDPSLFDALTAVNIRGVYYGCRAAWPVMRKQGGGVIVNISSVLSTEVFPGFAAYSASKAWVNAWTKALAQEGKPFGIRVFAVAPGAVETRLLRDAFPEFPKGQALDPDEVAGIVHMVAQPGCRHASGQTIFLQR